MDEIENLRKAIAAFEEQRALLGDAVVDAALQPLQEKLAALAAETSPAETQLKDITILFTDIVGSTQFSQELDPEDIQAILNGALQRFNDVIQRYQGRVVRFMGDGLKAVFGAPVSREDDTERAVRAGLELLRVAEEYRQGLRLQWGMEQFSIRVGINTGQVLLGGGMEADNNAMGMAVNLGARMESLAAPGTVLISHDTYRQVQGLFDVQEQPPARVKGSDKPVQTYVVLQARERSFRNAARGLTGLETPMVGRQAELQQLQDFLRKLTTDGETRIITLVGEAGVGKSRLLQEYGQWIGASGTPVKLFKGRALEHTSSQPYSLFHALLAYSFDIRESDALLEMRGKLEAGISEFLAEDSVMKAHFIGALSGFDFSDSPYLKGVHGDPRQLRDRALYYLTQYFNAAAERALLVIFLDDLHWSDSPSLNAVLTLSKECRGALFVCLTRRALFEKHPEWGVSDAHHAHIWLQPLSEQESGQLLAKILTAGDPIPEWLIKLIQENAEGNPYYIEEIIKNLIEESVIVGSMGDWKINTSRMSRLKLPPTLNALLQARLDRLEPGEKLLIQQASVVGRIFWDALLLEMRGVGPSAVETHQGIPELSSVQGRDLVVEQARSAFAGTREFSFKHSLLRDAAYRTVLKQQRRRHHRQVAEWLLSISRASDRSDEYAAVIADHFDQAGETGLSADFYFRAGELAKARFSLSEALAFYERALDAMTESDIGLRWRALLDKSEVLGILGEIPDRLKVDQELIALAQALGDQCCLGMAYYRQGFALGLAGDLSGEMLAYDQALEHAGRAGDLDTETLVLGLKGILFSRLGKPDDAAELVEKALSHARQATDDEVLARTLINAGTWFGERGEIGQSTLLLAEGVQVCERLGNKQGVAIALGNLGYYFTQLGLFEMGRDALQQSINQAQSIGNSPQITVARLNTALNLILSKDPEEALAWLEQVSLDVIQGEDSFGQAFCHTYTGLALEQRGDYQAACSHFDQAQRALNLLGLQPSAVDALAGRARCTLLQGSLEEAFGAAAEVWNHLQEHSSSGLEAPALAYLTCFRVFAAAGQQDAANQAIEKGAADLYERASKISDPAWRSSFLVNFPDHREIVALRDGKFD